MARFFDHGLTGGCERSGTCCRYITQPKSSERVVGRAADRVMRWWATEVNGFYARDFDIGEDAGAPTIVYSCRNLTAAGSCSNYRLRPTVCRMCNRVVGRRGKCRMNSNPFNS